MNKLKLVLRKGFAIMRGAIISLSSQFAAQEGFTFEASRLKPSSYSLFRLSRNFRCCLFPALFLSPLLFSGPALAESAAPREDQLKAVFVFNFTQFIQWPANAFPNATAPFCVGVLGDDPVGTALEEVVRGESVRDRPLSIQRSQRVEALKHCQIIFVSKSHKERLKKVLAELDSRPVVLVGETDDFAKQGGIINFYIDGNKLRFEINPAAARRRGLKMSSQLLRLGKIIEEN